MIKPLFYNNRKKFPCWGWAIPLVSLFPLLGIAQAQTTTKPPLSEQGEFPESTGRRLSEAADGAVDPAQLESADDRMDADPESTDKTAAEPSDQRGANWQAVVDQLERLGTQVKEKFDEHEPNPVKFELDPVWDTAVMAISLGMVAGTQAVITGTDLTVEDPGDPSGLFFLDRWAAEEASEEPASPWVANTLIAASAAGAATTAIVTGVKEGKRAGWTDLFLFAETVSVNLAVANLTKLAVRRPRPAAYKIHREEGELPHDTDLTLSFYSSHTATAAGIAATATYLAFARDHNPLEKWLTLLLGTGATIGVGVSRVASLSHFPTDVFVGLLIGASVGVMVPHLHLVDDEQSFSITVCGDGQTSAGLALSGTF